MGFGTPTTLISASGSAVPLSQNDLLCVVHQKEAAVEAAGALCGIPSFTHACCFGVHAVAFPSQFMSDLLFSGTLGCDGDSIIVFQLNHKHQFQHQIQVHWFSHDTPRSSNDGPGPRRHRSQDCDCLNLKI